MGRLIVGITGTLGAGKGAVVDHLVRAHGFAHFSVRAWLTNIIAERGLRVDRDSMTHVANELRAAHGPAYIVEQLLAHAAAEDTDAGGGAIIESVRSVGEVERLRAAGGGGARHTFALLAVDADSALRYDRAVNIRKSETDIGLSFERFLADEAREMNNADPHKQNLKGCIGMADATLLNNGSFEDLQRETDRVLRGLVPS